MCIVQDEDRLTLHDIQNKHHDDKHRDEHHLETAKQVFQLSVDLGIKGLSLNCKGLVHPRNRTDLDTEQVEGCHNNKECREPDGMINFFAGLP